MHDLGDLRPEVRGLLGGILRVHLDELDCILCSDEVSVRGGLLRSDEGECECGAHLFRLCNRCEADGVRHEQSGEPLRMDEWSQVHHRSEVVLDSPACVADQQVDIVLHQVEHPLLLGQTDRQLAHVGPVRVHGKLVPRLTQARRSVQVSDCPDNRTRRLFATLPVQHCHEEPDCLVFAESHPGQVCEPFGR